MGPRSAILSYAFQKQNASCWFSNDKELNKSMREKGKIDAESWVPVYKIILYICQIFSDNLHFSNYVPSIFHNESKFLLNIQSQHCDRDYN